MVWKIKYADSALKSLKKMDRQNAKRIVDYLDKRIASSDDPRIFGKSLKGDLGEFWRYRIGDYRVLCEIFDEELIILVATIGHRRKVYE
ncbi:addiction module toxin RelE [Candidatus Williamhamiltonella defendens]|uniref:Addiction module toxin RelE n=1 Tax=Candidatus Williamhamiltonella defendens TaxID=138072 RepID=A0A2D3T1J5_9ENTR|nr:type II toxin-antitoxin system RelE/ParE family toxin [Candidatus Hamiltonella defensa]ASV33358.1 type II toxin-antitoxin system mRNA interferase toxin, RelE/StbE family [Candidatus Hamiltonella defensa]ATW29660.1 addiction module toxin RelE [Candidatus Hamiltonella defensa]ATW31638.1 addiction module toxin RelE [Candidatus Hamiltonella defensa]ATW33652.1 addiction module toxin RelE [Candidatus Hamiltonella defensa]AWK16313.1 type II toxin-antitoxin system mRNA interferase toxin, RelE/StbE 